MEETGHRKSGLARRLRRAMPDWSPLLLLALGFVGCTKRSVPTDAELPGASIMHSGWATVGDQRVYDSQSIYELVNGQADAYFAYRFEQVAVQSYEDGTGATIDVEVWQVASQADAYGLFTDNRAGDFVQVGNAGDTDAGRRLAFWQDRYYVRVRARQEVPDGDLVALANAIAGTLPVGGERPELVNRLPSNGLLEDSIIYFHLETSIQDELWLGGENLLSLGLETDGVLARYDVSGPVATLLLVEYPQTEAAHAGLVALDAAEVSGLVATGVRGRLLGAVLGDISETDASALLADGLLGEGGG